MCVIAFNFHKSMREALFLLPFYARETVVSRG